VVRDGLVKKIHTKAHLYHNERCWLERLAHSGVTPEVQAYSDQELSITMRYSGEPIAAENAPHDWRGKLAHILSIMADAECHHGDLLPQNLLVHEGRLSVIDFALATSRSDPALRKKRTFSDAYAPSRIGYLLSGFPVG
jgi:tRNA A-37 threonylcarbamoyl transferase component Bud32